MVVRSGCVRRRSKRSQPLSIVQVGVLVLATAASTDFGHHHLKPQLSASRWPTMPPPGAARPASHPFRSPARCANRSRPASWSSAPPPPPLQSEWDARVGRRNRDRPILQLQWAHSEGTTRGRVPSLAHTLTAVCLRSLRVVGTIANKDIDWLWIDCEHGWEA